MESAQHLNLLDAIAADVRLAQRRLPCAVLRGWVQRDSRSGTRRTLGDKALLLAAVEHALLVAVQADWPGVAAPPPAKRWATSQRPQPLSVVARRLRFSLGPAGASLHLPLATYRFLSVLTPEFVRAIVRWAPPVVALAPGAGDLVPVVVENVVSAFLACNVLPAGRVWVRVREKARPVSFSLAELAAWAVPALTPVVARYRDRIVAVAPTAEAAGELAGLQQAMAFRIRQRAKAGDP